MTREGDFMIFCTEWYKAAKKLTGKQVGALFTEYGVWDYLYDCYDALHTTGEQYVIDDIDSFIEVRKAERV